MFQLHIHTDNAAFTDAPGMEIARILRKVADRVEGMGDTDDGAPIMDANGNRVGDWNNDPTLSVG